MNYDINVVNNKVIIELTDYNYKIEGTNIFKIVEDIYSFIKDKAKSSIEDSFTNFKHLKAIYY